MTQKRAASVTEATHGGRNGNSYQNHTTNHPSGRSFPVHNSAGRVVGKVDGSVFHKRVSGDRHMLRSPRGWAIDADTLADLLAWGVAEVRVTDTETWTIYSASPDEFSQHGVTFNRGFGPQVVLPLGYWSIDGESPANALRQPVPDPTDPTAPQQLSLWG